MKNFTFSVLVLCFAFIFNAQAGELHRVSRSVDVGFDDVLTQTDDEEPPVITCPVDRNESSEVDICGVFSSFVEEPTATDNVSVGDGITFTGVRDDGLPLISQFPIGRTVISWMATDEAGNTSEPCLQEVKIVDDVLPTVSCPPDISVLSEDGAPMTLDIGVATATDNCTEGLITTATRSDQKELDDPYPVGTTTILWKAVDEYENFGRCLQTITILNDGNSARGKAITALSVTLQIGPSKIDDKEKTVQVLMPFGTDLTSLSPSITVSDGATINPASGEARDFTEPVLYTVAAQNGTTQDWKVEIEAFEDRDALFLGCPPDPFVENDLGQCGAVVNFEVGYSPLKEVVVLSLSHNSGDFFEVGTTEVTATLFDISGEIISCSFQIDVVDTEPPVTECNDLTVGLTAEGFPDYSTDDVIGEISDNCELSFVVDNNVIEIGPGLFQTSIEVVDVNGNVSLCNSILTVLPPEENELTVTGFALIDAVNDEAIFDLENGMQIDLNDLPVQKLNIRALATDDAESVRLSLKGAMESGRTENLEPYALFGDAPTGTYHGRLFKKGLYEISATAFSEDRGKGTKGSTSTLYFEVIDSTPTLAVTGFTLIDAVTDRPILDLQEGMVLDIDDLPTKHLNIRANTTDNVESVRLSLTGQLETARTENFAPYAVYGDFPAGDYFGNDFVAGNYAVSATPFSKNELAGSVGSDLSIHFELIDTNQLVVSPNQAIAFIVARFTWPTDLIGMISVFDLTGRLVQSYNPSEIQEGNSYRLNLDFFKPGSYLIVMTDTHGKKYQKQIIVKGR